MFIITGRFAEFQSALRFAVVSDYTRTQPLWHAHTVSIRFKVRGGFRPLGVYIIYMMAVVSIRFKVRGGFRHRLPSACLPRHQFQSALRFAVVSDRSQLSMRRKQHCGFNPL